MSEVMLQQTQVSRVIPYYREWLERWPTVESLAKASAADVIRAWSGLGYNQRALRLRKAAISVVSDLGGTFPTDVAGLQSLSGIGAYTAAAVACFAGGLRVPLADTNIARVLARSVFGQARAKTVTGRQLKAAAEASLAGRNARNHNLALMDLGATVCRTSTPDCDGCPLRVDCQWLAIGRPDDDAPDKARAPKFEETARFARGRLVDELRRTLSLTQEELAELLPKPHRSSLDRYLDGLERDGLVERCPSGWRLPELKQ